MKKRVMALLTAMVMVFALAACGGKVTLDSVLSSGEWQKELKTWNDQVTSMGISIDTVADGNTLVFEWHMPAMLDDLSGDDYADSITPFLQVLEEEDFIALFKQEYKVSLDGVRCVVIKSDGSEAYRDELK